ncbi:MAG: hypothetical protein AABN95_03365 [Acidobacteriota bacterium]
MDENVTIAVVGRHLELDPPAFRRIGLAMTGQPVASVNMGYGVIAIEPGAAADMEMQMRSHRVAGIAQLCQ